MRSKPSDGARHISCRLSPCLFAWTLDITKPRTLPGNPFAPHHHRFALDQPDHHLALHATSLDNLDTHVLSTLTLFTRRQSTRKRSLINDLCDNIGIVQCLPNSFSPLCPFSPVSQPARCMAPEFNLTTAVMAVDGCTREATVLQGDTCDKICTSCEVSCGRTLTNQRPDMVSPPSSSLSSTKPS